MFDAAQNQRTLAMENWGKHQILPQRDHVAHEGDDSQYCYLLLRGVLAEYKLMRNGARQIIGLQMAGDMCGFAAIFGDQLSYDIVALSPVSYIPVSAQWLSDLAQRSDVVRRALWREIGRDAAIRAAWIVSLGQRPAFQRIAHLLCEIEARSRAAGLVKDGRIEWFGNQADLGAATGISLVHVNKTLRRLHKAGLLYWGRQHIDIHDLPKLHDIAGFDPAYLVPNRQSLGNLLLSQIDDLQKIPGAETVFRHGASPEARDTPFYHRVAG